MIGLARKTKSSLFRPWNARSGVRLLAAAVGEAR